MPSYTDSNHTTTLFLCGDVMTGRGVDQILPHPSKPILYEPFVKDAREYVKLAETAHGPIPDHAGFDYIWGEALEELERSDPDVRVINLETSITDNDEYWKTKGIHYRMHPDNAPCLSAANIGICTLANNHVLDWGYGGLEDTVEVLEEHDIQYTGAGEDRAAASSPALFELMQGGRVIVFSFGHRSSGIPDTWGAKEEQAGVNDLQNFSESTVAMIREKIEKERQSQDIVVLAIHWGSNWGYRIPSIHRDFAHKLIDTAGVDIIYGHSSHHALGIEVYRGKLILYGCGDFINDYEGIGGYEEYRADLPLMFLPRINLQDGTLTSMRIVPFHIEKLRLNRASEKDIEWMERTLDREGKKMGTSVSIDETGALLLQW